MKVLDEFQKINPHKMHVATTYYFYIVQYISEFLNSPNSPKQEALAILNNINERCIHEVKSLSSDRGYGMVLATLAISKIKEGSYLRAEAYAQEALATLDRWFGKADYGPEQGFVNLILGSIYSSTDQHDLALKYLKKSEASYTSSLKNMKIDNVSMLYTLLAKTFFYKHDPLATSFYTKEHIKLFGDQHPRSIALEAKSFTTPLDMPNHSSN